MNRLDVEHGHKTFVYLIGPAKCFWKVPKKPIASLTNIVQTLPIGLRNLVGLVITISLIRRTRKETQEHWLLMTET